MSNPFRSVGGRPHEGNDANPAEIGDAYEESAFYTRASDAKGHSTPYRVNVPKDWGHLISMVVEKHPVYETMASFMRDAVFHRLHYLLEHETDVALTHAMRRAVLQARMAAQEENNRQNKAVIEQMTRSLRELEICQNWDGLVAQCNLMREWADLTPGPFADQAKVLIDRYGG